MQNTSLSYLRKVNSNKLWNVHEMTRKERYVNDNIASCDARSLPSLRRELTETARRRIWDYLKTPAYH